MRRRTLDTDRRGTTMRMPVRLLGLAGTASAAVVLSIAPSWADLIDGTDGPDHLDGTAQADSIHGRGDNDTVKGLGGNDTLYGESGNDKLYGGDGADSHSGWRGRDRLVGGAGDDTFGPGPGADTVRGEGGNDRVYLQNDGRVDHVSCGAGTDTIYYYPKDNLDEIADDCEHIKVL